MSYEPKCEVGCMRFYGGELRHDKNCAFYPESRTEMYDKAITELAKLRTESLEAKSALEEMFRVDARLSPDYEAGWNAAIGHAIEKFGPNHLFHENESLLGDLADKETELARLRALVGAARNINGDNWGVRLESKDTGLWYYWHDVWEGGRETGFASAPAAFEGLKYRLADGGWVDELAAIEAHDALRGE